MTLTLLDVAPMMSTMDADVWKNLEEAWTEAFWNNRLRPADESRLEISLHAGGEDRTLHLLPAVHPFQRQLGLMFRTREEMYDGMFFMYMTPTVAQFHMANTHVPLRVYWFKEDGSCLGHADLEPGSYERVASPAPFKFALEVPMDVAETLGDEPRLLRGD